MKSRTPILDALMASGDAWRDGHDVLGRAYDGVTITLGTVFDQRDLVTIERYLRDHPTPETW